MEKRQLSPPNLISKKLRISSINPMDLPEIVETVCKKLKKDELKMCQKVNQTWSQACQRELHRRKFDYSTFRWMNHYGRKHQWYSQCGNDVLYHHAQCGALTDLKNWASSKINSDSNLTLLFTTGAVYVDHMVKNGMIYVLKSELLTGIEAALLLRSSALFLTSLKIMACDTCAPGKKVRRPNSKIKEPHCDLATLTMSKMKNIRPFRHAADFTFVNFVDILNAQPPKSVLRRQQIELFKTVTGVDPEREKILAIAVFNVRELMHVFRRVWQDFGPFPFIGCDSEGLAWHLTEKDPKIVGNELALSTAGFVVVEDKAVRTRTASIVLSVGDTIETKIDQLKDAGFKPDNSWGLALTSAMRGYDGDDITNEHIEAKDLIQRKECQLFHQIVGENYIGAQVEDVFGTNHIGKLYQFEPFDNERSDTLGLFTPEVHADDSSSVLLVIGEIE